jgi:hypothetical protein
VVLSKFYSFLNDPASIAILRELEDVIFDDLEKSMLMGILSVFKKFLEDIVSKLILS